MKLALVLVSILFAHSVVNAALAPCEGDECGSRRARPPVTCAAIADFRGKTCSFVGVSYCGQCGSEAVGCSINYAPGGVANGAACIYCENSTR